MWPKNQSYSPTTMTWNYGNKVVQHKTTPTTMGSSAKTKLLGQNKKIAATG
jgi:hypothetical protein